MSLLPSSYFSIRKVQSLGNHHKEGDWPSPLLVLGTLEKLGLWTTVLHYEMLLSETRFELAIRLKPALPQGFMLRQTATTRIVHIEVRGFMSL